MAKAMGILPGRASNDKEQLRDRRVSRFGKQIFMMEPWPPEIAFDAAMDALMGGKARFAIEQLERMAKRFEG